MIIFGTRGVKSTIKSGDFICPQCNQTKPYRHRKITRFFTLYFIPVIPLGKAGEYVECGNCKGTFFPRVLDSNSTSKEEFKAIYEKAIKHTMVLIMLADGTIDEKEKIQVFKIINKFSHNQITMNQLDDYIKVVQKENEGVTTYLKKIGNLLNEQGKEIIIKCALSVASADGKIDDSELKLIFEMGRSLEMSSLHIKGIFNDFVESVIPEQKETLAKERLDKEDHSRFMPK
jgi:uncharacterized tellurite resistance protein B-like protein